jgi:hypothetical protein
MYHSMVSSNSGWEMVSIVSWSIPFLLFVLSVLILAMLHLRLPGLIFHDRQLDFLVTDHDEAAGLLPERVRSSSPSTVLWHALFQKRKDILAKRLSARGMALSLAGTVPSSQGYT